MDPNPTLSFGELYGRWHKVFIPRPHG